MKTLKRNLDVRKGDFVVVLSGDEKGKKGKVLKVFPTEGRLIVEGVNVAKKHTRPSQKMPQGGTISVEQPISADKVMLLCPSCKQPSKVSRTEMADGKKVRVCKSCGEVIDK